MDIAKLGFVVDSSQAASATKNLDGLSGAAKRAETASEKMARQINRDVEQINRQMQAAAGFIKGLVAALASIQTVRALADMADTWSDLTSRVQVNIGATENAADVMDRLSQIARQTYSSLELTAESYARNAMTMNGLNKSTAEQLDYAQALNNALVVSGARQDRAIMVQNSLSKALAEGTLRGEELNNVLAYGGRVAELLADELGVNVTELRAVSAEGKITGDVLFNSLVKNMERLTSEAESMPATIGDGMTLIRNALLETIGVFDQAGGFSERFAEKLIVIADNMDDIMAVLSSVAAGITAAFGVKALAMIVALTTQVGLLGTALALVGGPIGLIAIAVGGATLAIRNMATGAEETRTSMLELKAAIDQVTTATDLSRTASVAALVGLRDEATARIEVAKAALEEEIAKRGVYQHMSPRVQAAREALAGLEEQGRRIDARFAEIARGGIVDFVRGALGMSAASGAASVAVNDLAGETEKAAKQAHELSESQKDAIAMLDDMESAARDAAQWLDSLLTANRDMAEELAGVGTAQRQYNRDMEELDKLIARLAGSYGELDPEAQAWVDSLREQITETKGLQDELDALADHLAEVERIMGSFGDDAFAGPIFDLADGIRTMRAEIERLAGLDIIDPDRIAEAQRALGRLNDQLQIEMVGSYRALLGASQAFASEGSKGYKAMEAGIAALAVVQDALALRAAVTAVLSQGQGDPYSAWARMAAMAAAVAPFLASIGMTLSGSVGGGGGGGPPQQQAMQGTGTVLGDSEAKSESILRATEITADATKQLVGINRGMLRALQALQASIGSASGMLARGAGGADFAGPGNPLDAGSRLAVSITNAVTGGILGGLAESVTRSILGARSRVSDIGILIGGGVITDLMDGIEIGAYQQTQTRSWWGGSTRTREQVESLDDGVARQFELIIGSIVESVRQGALALGLSADDIEAAIESFRLEEIRISTMDLSAEEQQAELEAVFSAIFDGLAGHVVPFIAQFQQVGEGLGETLVRVATSVQVTQEAVRQLGFSMDTIDPETVAQISVELIALAGGIDEFISGLATFIDKFAPESHKLAIAQDQLTRAFDGVGLALPGTRDEMWELMQSLDATTESGRAQIAILLELASVSDAYYTMLERGEEALERATQSYREFIDGFAPSAALDDPIAEIRRQEREAIEQAHAMAEAAGMQAAATEDLAIITAWAEREIAAVQEQYAAGMVAYRDYMDTITDRRGYDSVRDAIEAERKSMVTRANDLARAAGMEGAATQDLARIHRWAAGQIAAATLRVRDEITRLVAELSSTGRFVPGQGYIEGAVSDFETGAGGAIERVGDAAQRMYQQQLAAIQRISDYLVSMQFGPLSALSPMEQLEAARSQLEILQTAAMAGDADAMAALPQAAQQYLQLLQGAYASGEQYGEGYAWVQELLQAVVDQGPTVEPGESGVWDGYPGLTPDTLRERDAELVAQEAEYRAALAMDLAEHLGQLAELVNTPVLELAGLLGVALDDLVADLGINLQDITGNAVLALSDLADALGLSLGELAGELGLELADLGGGITELLERMGHSLDDITGGTVEAVLGLGQMLGLSLGEVTTALGLELTDLAGGLTELTAQVGIDLENLTTGSVAALADLATDLGIDLGDLATAVGAEIGLLTESQSLLNQTFAAELASLPDRERDLLAPLFDAVTNATSEADANAAIAELEAAVNDIGGGTASALAPYLDGVFPPEALTDLDYLGGIDTTAKAIKGVMDNQLAGINSVSTSASAMRTSLDYIHTVMDRVNSNLRAQNSDAGLPQFAAGGWVNGRTTLVAGEAGRELILPNHVSEFLARSGIPVNSGGMKEADTRRLEERLERIEAAITRADDRNVAVTEGGSTRVVGAVERASRDTNITRSR